MVQRHEPGRQTVHILPNCLSTGIIDKELGTEEVATMSSKTTGIIALVLGILVLVWPHWMYVIFGILLILIGVALLLGKMKSPF
jgi:hypothetical protein